MRVRCITTTINNPSEELLKSGWWHADGYLTVGKEYEVYAILSSFLNGVDAYLVCDDYYNDRNYYWPLYIPACYFEIIDESKPASWKRSLINPKYEGPSEIGIDKYEALIDGDEEILSSFRQIRANLEK